jgi:acetate kinase
VALLRASGDVLVVNAGSTSLKLSVVDAEGRVGKVESLQAAPPVELVGHRVVHGGPDLTEPTVIDDAVVEQLRALIELAPLHNRPAVEAIDEARRALPQATHVAVFDTAFHRTIPDVARTYALPARWRELGIRRYGFHGSSVQAVAQDVRVPRLVVCHLGGGSSITAVRDGASVDTTMGFTPLEGVPMVSRSGSVDPGALVHLLEHGVGVAELGDALEHESGLVGLAGSGDVAELQQSNDPRAAFALDLFAYRVAQSVAAMAAALDGLDALAFTAGIGVGSAAVRASVCERLGHLGVALDPAANAAADGDAEIGAGAVRVFVRKPREDLVVAAEVRRVV